MASEDWTEEDRETVLWELSLHFTPEQIARLPEEVQRGDRRCHDGPEWELWRKMDKEFTYKKAKRQVDGIASLPPEYQAEFPEDVRTGKREMNRFERHAFNQYVYEARSLLHYFGDKDSEGGRDDG